MKYYKTPLPDRILKPAGTTLSIKFDLVAIGNLPLGIYATEDEITVKALDTYVKEKRGVQEIDQATYEAFAKKKASQMPKKQEYTVVSGLPPQHQAHLEAQKRLAERPKPVADPGLVNLVINGEERKVPAAYAKLVEDAKRKKLEKQGLVEVEAPVVSTAPKSPQKEAFKGPQLPDDGAILFPIDGNEDNLVLESDPVVEAIPVLTDSEVIAAETTPVVPVVKSTKKKK